MTSLKWWCNFRKWKNILLQELSLRDPNQLGIWGKDSEGFEGLNRSVWSKFKKDHGVTKAKWVKLYDSAGETWLNKKRAANFKKLEAPPKLDRVARVAADTPGRKSQPICYTICGLLVSEEAVGHPFSGPD